MPIRKHLTDKTSFGPDTIEKMSKAFEEACIALRVVAGDEKGREIVATRIVDLARNGLVDPEALRDRVVSEARRVYEGEAQVLTDRYQTLRSTTATLWLTAHPAHARPGIAIPRN